MREKEESCHQKERLATSPAPRTARLQATRPEIGLHLYMYMRGVRRGSEGERKTKVCCLDSKHQSRLQAQRGEQGFQM